MALRGVKPSGLDKRLKALFFGKSGVGKTTAAIQFPSPYIIDTERGAENSQYAKLIEGQGGAIYQTTDFDDLIAEVKALMSENHPYKTLVIDPLSTIYNDLLDKFSEAMKKNGQRDGFAKHYQEAGKCMKRLLMLLYKLDMNVIITAHAKKEYGDGMVVLGQTFDCFKGIDYAFDLAIEVKKQGKNRVGQVVKSRIETFEEGESFPFSYDEMAKRYGRNVIEKDTISRPIATKIQVEEIFYLLEMMQITDNVIVKVLEKAQVDRIEDMDSELAQKWIDSLNSRMKKPRVPQVKQFNQQASA